MSPPRPRISTLIGIVLACALGLAVLRRPSSESEQAAFSATVAALILGIMRAVHRPGAARAFWSGFSLAGGVYLALALIPATEGRLVTTRAAKFLAGRAEALRSAPDEETIIDADGTHLSTISSSVPPSILLEGRVVIWHRGSMDFARACHDFLALIFGAIAGMIGRAWWQGRGREEGRSWDRLGRGP